jgi:hypothetical protein
VLIRILDRLWKGVRYAAYLAARATFLADRGTFYARYFGCDHPALLLVKNLLNPARFIGKLQYGGIGLLPEALRKGDPAPAHAPDATVLEQARMLREQGFVALDGARPELADHFLHAYADFIAGVKPAARYYNLVLREIDQEILEFITDPILLRVMSAHWNGRQPYLRSAATLKSTWPLADRASTRETGSQRSEFNVDWHYDTVNMVQIHFLLNDLTVEDTHMALVAGECRTHRVPLTPEDYSYSDEYIARHYRTVPFVGRKGTILLWDSNAPHAAMLRKDRRRDFVQLLYSPGNDILTRDPRFGMNWGIAPEGLDIGRLPEISRRCLRFVVDDRPAAQRKLDDRPMRDGTEYARRHQPQFEISNF